MKAAVGAFVAMAVAVAVWYGLRRGLDATGALILVAIVGLGALGVAVASRFESGDARPALCGECGGLISPNAPYCKHCGSQVTSG